MLKYGDLDALFEMVSTIREVYPRCRLRVVSSREAVAGNIDLGCDLILIGGPDYNETCANLMREAGANLGYAELDCDREQSPIALSHTEKQQHWRVTHKAEDYGYIEVVDHPFAKNSRVFFFGGCHTIGVTGAVKALQLKRDEESGLTPQTAANVRRLLKFARFRRRFAAVFRVTLMGATIPPPSLEQAEFFGGERRLFGLPMEWAFRGVQTIMKSSSTRHKSKAAT